MNLSRKIASIAVPVILSATGVVGGIVGNEIRTQNLAHIAWVDQVNRMTIDAEARAQYTAGQEARAIVADFQPTLDAAKALIASSDDKASAEARVALQGLTDQVERALSTPASSGKQARLTAQSATLTATPRIASASQKVSDEVAAWETAEAERIAAEQAAAEAAAREAAASRSYSGGSSSGSTSTRSSGSSNSSSGSSGSGGGSSSASSDGRAWAESIVRSVAGWDIPIYWGFVGPGKYSGITHSDSVGLSDTVANGSSHARVIAAHEGAHVRQYGVCNSVYKNHFGYDGERFAQAWTVAHGYGSVGAYAYPTQADIDAAATC